MTNKTVFIHIGFGKTGTSAIQSFLFQHSMQSSADYLYPKAGLKGNGHHDLAELNTSSFSSRHKKLYAELIREIIENDTTSKVIISSEYFCFVQPSYIYEVSQFLKDFSVKIIFYIRQQLPLIQSSYLQAQKVGRDYEGAIANYFKIHAKSFDFMERIKPWTENFGINNIIVRLYDKRVIGEDICLNLMDITELGIKLPTSINTNIRFNESLITEFSEVISLLDSEGLSCMQRQKYIDHFLRLSSQFRNLSSGILVPPELNDSIREYYTRSNIEFAKHYLSEEPAKLLLAL